MRKIYRFLCILSILLLCTGCQKNTDPITKTDFYFDTIISVTVYHPEEESALEGCFSIAEKYENLLSATKEGSDVWNINHANGTPVTVSDETILLLEKAIEYSQLSDGSFDITIGAVSALWDFKTDTPTIPSKTALKKALSTVNYENIMIDGNTVTLTNPDTRIDLGGIAKGFIADEMKAYLIKQNVNAGIINLGGNVLTLGTKDDGSSYTIGMQKPFHDGETVGRFTIADTSLVSSGIYERYFELNDTYYHHLLNPKTGYPYDNGLLGVTIITHSSVDADALSTTCFALGLKEGMQLIEELDDVEAIFITTDNKLHKSSGIGNTIDFNEI